RFREHRHTVERSARAAGAEAGVGQTSLGEHGGGQDVDRAPAGASLATAVEGPRRDLGGGPFAAAAAGLVVGDGTVERIGAGPERGRERERGQRGELGQDFASGGRHRRSILGSGGREKYTRRAELMARRAERMLRVSPTPPRGFPCR